MPDVFYVDRDINTILTIIKNIPINYILEMLYPNFIKNTIVLRKLARPNNTGISPVLRFPNSAYIKEKPTKIEAII